MGYISFNLQLQGRRVVIVGGGSVAQRKILNILPADPAITVISPTLSFELQKLRSEGKISQTPRGYLSGDLDGAFLVIAATSNHDVNAMVAKDAAASGILAEITDNPLAGNVTSPAVIHQGDLSIAISTNNRVPVLAAIIKKELAQLFGPEYARTIRLLGAIREKLLTDGAGSTYNKQVLSDLAEQLPHLLASGVDSEIDALLQRRLGTGYSLASIEPVLEDPQ